MSSEDLNIDSLLQRMGGCGVFQVVFTSLAVIPYLTSSFSLIFMAYGNYNPGWRCLDNYFNNGTGTDVALRLLDSDQTSGDFTTSCDGHSSCQHVQFNPDASTIATEWGLICGQEWILSTIIAIQMAGMTFGSFLAGYFGDAYGRKITLYVSALVHAAANLASVFSVSWEMFAVIRFIMGMPCSIMFSVTIVYINEFAAPKWRVVVSSLPIWCVGCVILSMSAFFMRDWKHMHVFNTVFSLVSIVPAFGLPESLRWLVVKGRQNKALNSLSKVAKLNKVEAPTEDCKTLIASQKERGQTGPKRVSFFGLFKGSNRLFTLIIGFELLTLNIVYFATSFGVSALPGDIYVNNIIVYVTELPANFIAWFAPNKFGRRPSAIAACITEALSLSVFIAFDFLATGTTREIGMLSVVIVAKIGSDVAWYIMTAYINELYPTVIRAAAGGWMLFSLGIGAILAPYFIPSDSGDLFITYIVMAILCLVGAALALLLPETKGKGLEDNFVEEGEDEIVI